MKDWLIVNKYRLISFSILLVAAVVVVLLFASGQNTRDFFFKKYHEVLRWRNNYLSAEIETLANQKKEQKKITEEKLVEIEEQLASISSEREGNDEFIETISYRELSDLLDSLVK